MSRSFSRLISSFGVLTLLAFPNVSSAQYYSPGSSCYCAQPIVQTAYRTVPVTEYHPVTQTVRRPIYETKYENREYTAYRPVVEQKTVDVPTVSYEDITEYKTVNRDAGYWTTHYQPRQFAAPSQYDPRMNLLGWLNRTAYEVRVAFTPRYSVRRQYNPRVISQQIPYTRRVAHHGTRKVTYNVTKMVAYTASRKVAVNTVRYISEKVTTNRPVTVWRSLPIGTTVAYAYSPFVPASKTVALRPQPDPISRSAKMRSADSRNNRFNKTRSTTTPQSGQFEKNKTSPKSNSQNRNGFGQIRSQHPRTIPSIV